MTFRWYGEGNDSITPQQIKQIPGVTGLVWALHDKQAGEVWTVEEIEEARRQIEGDGSTALFYEKSKIQDDYKEMARYILENLHGMTFPGWEPERMAQLDELFEKYRPVTKEKLWENLKYFLEAVMPVCHETGIKLAIHQDEFSASFWPWCVSG